MTSTPPLYIPQHSGLVRLKRAREHDAEEVEGRKSKGKEGTTLVRTNAEAVGASNCDSSHILDLGDESVYQGTTDTFHDRGGSRRRNEPGCENLLMQDTKGKRKAHDKCNKSGFSNISQSPCGRFHNLCIGCDELGCEEYSQDAKSGKCITHGGGQGSNEPDCRKLSKATKRSNNVLGVERRFRALECEKNSRDSKCIALEGDQRCDEADWDNSSKLASGKCKTYGGRRHSSELG